MDSISNRATNQMRRPTQEPEKRPIAFFLRAKTGPDRRDWSPVGVMFERRNGPGYTIKLNTLPISGWNGEMVAVPPFEVDGQEDAPNHTDEAVPMPETTEGFGRRRRAKEPDPTV